MRMLDTINKNHTIGIKPQLDTINKNHTIGIKPQKARHDVTKLDLTIPLLSLWYIDIDLSIQSMSFTLYMSWVY